MKPSDKFNFCNPQKDHDNVLVVEGKKFYVIAEELSSWSLLFFQHLFSQNLKDITNKEIEIKIVGAEDFEKFIMYTSSTEYIVTENNLISLVKMSHFFIAAKILTACEKFIEKNFDNLDIFDLLEISVEYEMEELKKRIGSLIFASLPKNMERSRCGSCKYPYDENIFCKHSHSFTDEIFVNSFIHQNQDRISVLSNKAQSFILHASVGNY